MVTELIDGYRLSPQQRRVWRLQQQDGGSYRTVAGVLLEGRVQQNRLQSALEGVIARHEILRTNFRLVPGMSFPLQVINTQASPAIDFQDLADLGPAERNARLDQIFSHMMRQPFASERGTPLQASLASLSQDKHMLVLGLPALCSDRTSLGNLAREIARFYDGTNTNGEDPVQYVEASEVFLELLESEETEAGRDYWRLQNLPDLRALKLPLERPLGAGASFVPAVLNFKLDSRTISEVERVASENGTTPAVFLLACWHVLLWRLTGQSEMMVGFAANGRTHEDLNDALGLYERYLPISSLLDSNMPFAEVLRQLHKTTDEALNRQDYFDWGQIAGFDSGDAKLPACPFMLDFDSPSQTDSAGGVTLRLVRQYSCSDRFRLKLSARPVEDGLALSLHYDSSVYGRKQAAAIARHYATLLSSAVAAPSAKAGSLNLLHPAQRGRLLRYSRHPQPATSLAAPFHELFARQVSRTPDAIAVRDEAGQVTYRELDQRSNQLARYLRRQGVGPERVVAIHMPRSLQMVEAVLGVLKAGGAYLPLDPNAPEERLQLMLQDANALIVLAQIDPEAAHESTEPLDSKVSEQSLAYIIYTSGSTGKPKGVMVQHGSLSEYLGWVNNTLLAGPVNNLPVATNLSFDMCLKQLFAPLVSGNEAWLLPEEVVTQPDALAQTLSTRQQFGFNCVPSLWKAILDSVEPAGAALLSQRLGLLVFGAERLHPSLVQRTFELAPRVQLWNIYGPTEITANACGTIVNNGDEITIGRPLSHVQIYLLDEHLNQVPLGVAGEIYVGGGGVARGYQSQPELTAEKFIPDAFGTPGSRLYRTGDLARLLPDGRIDFIGRADHQVKIRGYRIELGEIETALARHPNVREAVVVAREEIAGEARLVGYVTAKPGHEVRADELREYLQSRLPNYMVPAAFVTLAALPLTANGKIDRRALPAPEAAGHARWTEVVAPRTPTEKLLTEIWSDVLGLNRAEVGVADNFFELGGDSILAIKIVARSNAAGLSLATGQLFRHQTIAELAEATGVTTNVRAQQDSVTGAVPLTPIQHWFFENPLPNPHHFNQSLMIEIRKSLDTSLVEEVVTHLIAHHDAFRLRFRQEDGSWRQFATAPDSNVPFSRVDVSQHTAAALTSAIETAAAEAQASLNITDGPLLRVVLFDAGEHEPARLLIVVHHLAMDIVSWSALLEDFNNAYEQLSRGEAVRLPAKTTSYKTWAERLQSYARSEELRREAKHWLAPAYQSVSRLPVDYPEGANDISTVSTFHVSLDEDETAALLREIPKARRAQIHEVLLTALAQALGSWTGDGVALINVEGHGRESVFDDINVSRTVGWFTAIYPLLLDVSGATDPDDALRSVMNHIRRTPNGGLGYSVLRYLGDDEIRKKFAATPKPQVIFNYQGQAHRTEDSPFQVARESSGPDSGPRGNRRHLLDVNAGVAFDHLKVHWTYSEAVHRRSTIEKLADNFVESLRELISHCRSKQSPVLIPPPEFAQAGLDDNTLQNIMARVKFD